MRHVVALAGWRLMGLPIAGNALGGRRTILGGPAAGCTNVTSPNLNLDAICCMTFASAARRAT
jgi:hypothetical protein